MDTPETSVEAQVRVALASWLHAFNAKDAQAFAQLYDPDIVYANAFAPLRRGIDEVTASFTEAFADAGSRISFREEALFASTEMALISGTFHFTTHHDDGTTSPGNSGRVALLYRRAADGRWLMAFDIDNTPPDAADYR